MSRSRVPWLYRFVRDRQAQSEPLAVILLVGLTLVGAGTVVVFGANAIDESATSVDVGQAEHAMTQLDSKASLVAHGSSDSQRVTLRENGRGTTSVDNDAGRMTVRIINGTHGNETILNESLGAVRYERGQTTLAYQGGGVWRTDGSGSTMVSPPEFHYQGETLTLPLVRVRSDGFSGGRSVRLQAGDVEGKYPLAGNDTLSNPLTQGTVYVTVQSDYYRAWGSYFADRTAGEVTYDHGSRTARIELQTPFEEQFGNVLATTATGDGAIRSNGGPPPSPSATGVNYPLADNRIDTEVQNCLDGSCTDWPSDDTITSGGTYYTEGSASDITVDTNDDVTLIVNGSFDGGVDINSGAGGGNVTMLVQGPVTSLKSVNDGGSPEDLRVVVHSDYDVDSSGNADFVGLLYAPGSDITLKGSSEVTGGLVGETIRINGRPSGTINYDDRVENIDLNVGSGTPSLMYLHVSVTTVTVEDD